MANEVETEYVERMVLRVQGVDLDDVLLDVKESGETPSKFVNTMNKARRPRGVKQSNTMYKLSISAERIEDPRVPDWWKLMEDRTTIKIVSVPNVGKAKTYTAKITSVADDTSDGDSKRAIEAMAWRRG